MDIKQYLALEGIECRLTDKNFEKLIESAGDECKADFDKNSAEFDSNPNVCIKAHYEILAKYKILGKSHCLLFEEIVIHMPQIVEKIKPYKRVLDAGCGDALKLAYYAQECPDSSFLGIDYGLESIALAEQRIKKMHLNNAAVRVLDISDVKQLNGKFDCIIATNVLHERHSSSYSYFNGGEWVQDIASGMYNLGKVLQTSGRFIFTLHFGDESCKEYMTNTQIKYGLEIAGLVVEEQADILFNHFDHQTLNGLWVCKKK